MKKENNSNERMEVVNLMKYVIIDMQEGEYYYCSNDIILGFKLDMILEERDNLEINYKTTNYNNGKVVVIR